MDFTTIILLISVGIIVGLLNTYAGAAAALSIALYTALGMPINVANGTNRIPVMFQTMTMTIGFKRQGVLDLRVGLKLSIPTIIGAIVGSIYASKINPTIFETLLGAVLLLLIALLIFDPSKLKGLKAKHEISKIDYFWFLLIGLYGGFFHIGVGYFIMAVAILSLGYDLVRASAIKGFVVMTYIPFTIVIFGLNDNIWYSYGLVHAIGNVIGSWIATSYAKKIPMNLIRWSLFTMIIITVLDLFKIISIADALNVVFTKLS